MKFFNSALGKNITFVRPAYFTISGFIGIPHVKYYYIFLCFMYIFSVLANTAVMAVICLDRNLRTPKYIIVFNLAFTDLFSNSALVPKVLDIFLFNHHHIPYNDCLTFLFFCYTCLSMQSLNLAVLSYDRLIAITYPLHYQVKITHRFMFSVVASCWLSVVTVILIVTGLVTRLSFCQSVVIRSYFCDHGPLYRLACNDITPTLIMVIMLPVLILGFPLIFILCTYLSISYSLSKVASVQGRMKALKTCTAHLSLVAIYFIPIIVTYMFGKNIHPNARIINLSLSSIFPPMLNPVIYVLQTQEIKESVRKLLKIRKKSGIKVKKVIIKSQILFCSGHSVKSMSE